MLAFYEQASRIGGTTARSRLAGLTMIPSVVAESLPDKAEDLQAFKTAMKTIEREFKGRQSLTEPLSATTPGEGARQTTDRRQRYSKIMSDLLAQRTALRHDRALAFARVTESASSALDVERASIWLLDEKRTLIRCADLFQRDLARHSSGIELKKVDFPSYFVAMLTERTIAADNANTDPRTSCFSIPYLQPLGINSMLDVPIWTREGMQGVLCHEQVGNARTWLADEEDVAYSMAGFVALVLEA